MGSGHTQSEASQKFDIELGKSTEHTKGKKKFCRWEINDLTLEWFQRLRAQDTIITGPMILDEAKNYAVNLKKEDFRASNGWLQVY